MSIAKYSKRKMQAEIVAEAKALGIQVGAAKLIADKVIQNMAKWMAGRTMVTETDLYARVAQELKPYNKDLAYMFKNKGRIL